MEMAVPEMNKCETKRNINSNPSTIGFKKEKEKEKCNNYNKSEENMRLRI